MTAEVEGILQNRFGCRRAKVMKGREYRPHA